MSTPAGASSPHHILAKAGPYPLAAYAFVQEGLRFTVRRVQEDRAQDNGLGGMASSDHVSGQQLCVGLRDYAIEQYGMLARVVLEHWQIRRTDDFGRMVFAMIEAGSMSKTPQDCPEDFSGVFDFDEAFDREHVLTCIRPAGG
jgi:uncharacterized repeat protein (TIGR04138 family)